MFTTFFVLFWPIAALLAVYTIIDGITCGAVIPYFGLTCGTDGSLENRAVFVVSFVIWLGIAFPLLRAGTRMMCAAQRNNLHITLRQLLSYIAVGIIFAGGPTILHTVFHIDDSIAEYSISCIIFIALLYYRKKVRRTKNTF